jgi:hypothetical protein
MSLLILFFILYISVTSFKKLSKDMKWYEFNTIKK